MNLNSDIADRVPPGPKWARLPVLGSLPWLRADTHVQFAEWAKLYGSIFHVKLGSLFCVVLNDLKLIKEGLSREEFSGRPKTTLFDYYTDNLKKGVLFNEGDIWKEQRRFSLHCLRDFGMGRFTLESKIMDEVTTFLDILEHEDNKNGFDPHEHISVSTSVVIGRIIFGKIFEHDDMKFISFLDSLREMAHTLANGSAVNFIPFLRWMPGNNNYQKFKRHCEYIRTNFFEPEIKEHMGTLDVDNPRDFIDAYLIRMEEMKQSKTPTNFSLTQLVVLSTDVFGAGNETVYNTLNWGFLYMLQYPQIQRKVQEELDNVVGRGRLPSTKDQADLPYTHATVLEILRQSSVVPLSVIRATVVDTTLGGYKIPNRTVIMPNIWAVHHDPQYWENPEEFRPERFLTAEGNVYRPDAFIPFSWGTRVCLGELLARMETFLFFACVLHRYELRVPEGSPMPEDEAVVGITLSTKPFKMRVVAR